MTGLVWLAKQPEPTSKLPPPKADTNPDREKPVFEFYDRLLNDEVVVNVNEEEQQAAENNVIYILQAASFQQFKEADALKAQLILLGLDVNIQEFKNKGQTWYRVLVGPFDSRSKMAKAKSTLAQLEISPIMLKQQPESP
jgi:cell division protein FtsN